MKSNFKNMLLTMVAAGLTLSSCSQDETVDSLVGKPEPRQEIEFHLDMMSRATDRTIANLDTIWVFADDGRDTIFNVTPFVKDQYGNFKPEEKIYWPDGKDNISFTAFWPSPEVLSHDPNDTDINHCSLSMVPGNVTLMNETAIYPTYHYDLITATTTVQKDKANSGIPLAFKHAYAQIEIRAKIGESAEHRVDIAAVALRTHSNIGRYSFTQNLWTVNTAETSYNYSAPKNILTVSSTATSLTDKTGPIYISPADWQFVQYETGGKENSRGVLLIVFGKVFDEKLNQIYPTVEDKENRHRVPEEKWISNLNPVQDISDYGFMRIQLGKEDLKLEAGHKYVFTIDFTNGVGYYGFNDPESPSQPILNTSLSAKVTMEDWASYDFGVDANQ